jgi:hypothetical protein
MHCRDDSEKARPTAGIAARITISIIHVDEGCENIQTTSTWSASDLLLGRSRSMFLEADPLR